MSQFVVWYDSAETGAPVLNNVAGSLIGVLDACLVNGFNLKAITSLVIVGGVATATCNGHGYSGTYGKDVVIAGATPAGLNGRKALTYVDTNTFRFDATGVTDQTATGTITAKRDSLGWVKQFAGTNTAMYKRSDVTATTMMLRVLDTAATPASATDARVIMVETATDVDTYTGQSPLQSSLADGQWWNKGANSVTAKQWALIGDSKGFYLWTQSSTVLLPAVTDSVGTHSFGDYPSLKVGDAYNCMLDGYIASGTGTPTGTKYIANTSTSGDQGFVTARSYSQTGGAVPLAVLRSSHSGGNLYAPSPSVIDSGFVLAAGIPILEGSSPKAVRGYLPGWYDFYNNKPSTHYTVIPDAVGVGGRRILAMSMPAGIAGGQQGQAGFDLTGPWR